MSLHIYRSKEEVPADIKYIKINDTFFDVHSGILDTPLVAQILRDIDKAERTSDQTFLGRTKSFGNLFKQNLSTGTKTLLNILNYPNLCFDTLECGDNVLQFIPYITEGYIVWESPVLLYTGNGVCDIIYKEKHFTDFYDFLDITMNGD